MLILVCFPHYTCGGLLCDMLDQKSSAISNNGAIESKSHNLGKIGDSESVYDDYDSELFYEKIKNIKTGSIGTHCHPSKLNLSRFDLVYNITTSTYRSKVYRWIRAYTHYFSEQSHWTSLDGIDKIDKQRETAKNYLKSFDPVFAENVVNIEFSEVIDESAQFKKIIEDLNGKGQYLRWVEVNKFLYATDLWNSSLIMRFHEAEFETNLQIEYRYC
jgi:hypothetical protein